MTNNYEKVLTFIYGMPSQKASTNHLRDFGRTADGLQGAIEKRARELVAKGQLSRRWITRDEMMQWGYNEKVKVFELTESGCIIASMISAD